MTPLAPLPSGRPAGLVYFGTPEAAVMPLQALVAAGFDIRLVVTRADTRRGRGSAIAPSAVKLAAQRLLLPVGHRVDEALDVGADLGIVVAFGQLIRAPVLELLPMVNLHFSLLPRWRGAAPVERALLAGDGATGVCLMQLEVGLDTGPILDVDEVTIGERDTAESLRDRLVHRGAAMLVDNLRRGLGPARPQRGEPTYAAKLDPREFEIDWTRSAPEIDRMIRVGAAWTTFRQRRLKVLDADLDDAAATGGGGASEPGAMSRSLTVTCGAGSIRLTTVQPEGRAAMSAAAWSHGTRPRDGERFGRPTPTTDPSTAAATDADASAATLARPGR